MAKDEALLGFYAAQSRLTEPGEMRPWLDSVAPDVEAMAAAANGLVLHYRADDPVGKGVPAERLREIDTRYAESMLAAIVGLDDRPLGEARDPKNRLIGCCRDYAVLFCALARNAGLPVRARVGFASYFAAGYLVDHVVAEVFDPESGSSRLVDPELAPEHTDPTDGESFSRLDVPRERFQVAGDAWQRCRDGRAEPERYLVDPSLDLPMLRGWPYLAHNLVHDLAALNKNEMLLWDSWGVLESDEQDRELLDQLAALTNDPGSDLVALRKAYETPGYEVPREILSYDPLGGPPRTVVLSA